MKVRCPAGMSVTGTEVLGSLHPATCDVVGDHWCISDADGEV